MTPVPLVGASDLAPLRQRLELLQLLRWGMAASVVAAAVVARGGPGGDRLPWLALLGVAYAAVTGAVEVLRRRLGSGAVALVGGLILLDGLYLAAVLAGTGGARSALFFVVLVHVIAVTLLLSFRSGLKTALWHALLLFGITWLQQAEVIDAAPASGPEETAALRGVVLLAVAGVVAWFSSLNEGELRRGKAELGALARMAAHMAGLRQPAQLAHALLRGVTDAFAPPRAAVVVKDHDQARAFVLDGRGGLVEAAGGPAAALAGHSRVPELRRSLDGGPHRLVARALPGAVNVVVVPLVADGEVLGVVALERGGDGRTRVSTRTVDLLRQFAAHGALALQAAALQAEVTRLADTDALTGLANRRVFQATLAREVAAATRRSGPCGLVLLDIDHFKAINDTRGHQVGDEVLRRVAAALGGAAREMDLVARYGGEEFAAVLPDCPPAEARAVAERLRAAVAGLVAPVAVTLSAGVACFPADAEGSEALVAAADEALYRAKRTGRDRTVRFRRRRRRRLAAA